MRTLRSTAMLHFQKTSALLLLVQLGSVSPPCAEAKPDFSKLPPSASRAVEFVRDIRPIFEKHCYPCHGPNKQKSDFRLDVKSAALKGGVLGQDILPGKSAESPLLHFVAGLIEDMQMPPEGERLAPAEIGLIRAWIDQGAHWPDGIDAIKIKDKSDHWAFTPVIRPAVPKVRRQNWPRTPIDRFILARLEKEMLDPSPEAGRLTLLRRLHFNLIGLPPTPEEVRQFLSDRSPDSVERLVDRLLNSPQYGERWARHWLDIIAFGETHGFEVNTPRDNAWPFRDYVIRAFNEDKPYPEFIKDQIAGDVTGEEPATGFIVAAAALLQGQIGRDLESMLLARQDELNNMVLGAGSAFLGLTVSCARCHDHKFDPISQRDYYSMQAVFAGVHYGERPLRTPESEQRKQEANKLKPRLTEIESKLAQFEPRANPVFQPTPPPDPKRNEESFDPIEARFVRFTIHDANLHPSLGLIEPCLDELEIFSAEPPARNVAVASAGAKLTASGAYPNSEMHRLEHLNDGRYGNSRSWISDEKGRGWVMVELPQLTRIDKIVWGRDREGKFTDRLPTSYTIEAGASPSSLRKLVERPPLRSAVQARLNVDRFSPLQTRRVRFTILETSNLEPCLDELEVFTAGDSPRNVALSASAARVTASGTIPNSTIHRLEHINDGVYGNGRSWISHETGKGWVEIEWPAPLLIDRVVWSRDREEKFKDRLPVRYQIEVETESGSWKTVASHVDRRSISPGETVQSAFSTAGLTAEESVIARRLVDQRRDLELRIKELSQSQMVYAGYFTKPEPVHRLNRGDPMQKREEVAPGAVARIQPPLELPADAPEQERRVALARWIAHPQNPLTARVLVNRVWQHHFGEGIVSTPSDFGNNGAKPIHPELLDWLASEFTAQAWSIKKLQRLICLSSVYRQASYPNSKAAALDAATRWLWRFPPRRLDAEVIRDAMLSVCGTLDLRMAGPGYSVFAPNDNYVRVYDPKEEYGPAEWRRMIYQTKVRMAQDSTFGAFDCPDAGQVCPKRSRSTTPLQALNLFNSGFVHQQADRFAERLTHEAGNAAPDIVRRAFQLAFGRAPTTRENQICRKLVEDHGVAAFCRVILNSNEFVFLN